jgi:selenocysteine lyase/cysteine desulfurase
MFAFAGHKGLLALTGVGGLLVKNLKILKPIMFGGTGTESENLIQPTLSVEGFETGTISTISILSLNAGVEFVSKNFEIILKKEQSLKETKNRRPDLLDKD